MSDKVPEWAQEAAAKIAAEAIELHTDQEIEGLSQEIAAALLSAERRGIERAIPTLERLRHWIEDEVGAELPFTDAEQAEFDVIRRLGEAE